MLLSRSRPSWVALVRAGVICVPGAIVAVAFLPAAMRRLALIGPGVIRIPGARVVGALLEPATRHGCALVRSAIVCGPDAVVPFFLVSSFLLRRRHAVRV